MARRAAFAGTTVVQSAQGRNHSATGIPLVAYRDRP
jgi:hypothetical protein